MTEHLLVCNVIKLISFSIRWRFFFLAYMLLAEKKIELGKYDLHMLLLQTAGFSPKNNWNILIIFKKKNWQQVPSTSDHMRNKQNKWTSWNATVHSTSAFKTELGGNSFNSGSWKMTTLDSVFNMNVFFFKNKTKKQQVPTRILTMPFSPKFSSQWRSLI